MATADIKKANGIFYDENNLNAELGMRLSSDRSVDWNDFIQKMKDDTPTVIANIQKKMLDVHDKREAFQLFGVLTPEECQYLIDATESLGYQKLQGYSGDYRSNTRRIVHYEDLRDVIWERVKPFLTLKLEATSLERRGSTWTGYGLNPQFRFCKYEPGQKFGAHYDAHFSLSASDRSFYTFMIYLNGGFEGGATNFLSDSSRPPRGRVLASLPPEAGMLLVFEHNIYHEGEILKSGRKYMMRSDVMFKMDSIAESAAEASSTATEQ